MSRLGDYYEDAKDTVSDAWDSGFGDIVGGLKDISGDPFNRDNWDRLASGAMGVGPLALGPGTQWAGLAARGLLSPYYNYRAKKAQEAAEQAEADEARRAEAGRQAFIKQQVQNLRAEYGMDPEDANDAALTGRSKLARERIDEYLKTLATDYSDSANMQVQDLYRNANLSSQQQMARQGLVGGSVDAQATRDNLSRLVAERQNVVRQSKGQVAAGKTALDKQRQALEGQITAGLDPSWTDIGHSQDYEIQNAMAQNRMAGIGDSFTALASGVNTWTDREVADRSRSSNDISRPKTSNGTISR